MESFVDGILKIKIEAPPNSPRKRAWTIEELIQSHAHHLMNGTKQSHESSLSEAATELRVTAQLFPLVTCRNEFLLLAAWFSYACRFDDIIEALSNEDSVRALATTRNIFRVGDTGLHAEDGGAHHLSRALYARLSYLMESTEGVQLTCNAIDKVMCAFEAERSFLLQQQWSVESYMEIRHTTISFGPIYAILSQSVVNPQNSPMAANLIALGRAVSLAAGLQNDIAGTQKDKENECRLNYSIIHHLQRNPLVDSLARMEMEVLRPGIRAAIQRHNEEAIQAFRYLRKLQECGTAEEQVLAVHMYVLMYEHFQWVKSSSRYRQSWGSRNSTIN